MYFKHSYQATFVYFSRSVLYGAESNAKAQRQFQAWTMERERDTSTFLTQCKYKLSCLRPGGLLAYCVEESITLERRVRLALSRTIRNADTYSIAKARMNQSVLSQLVIHSRNPDLTDVRINARGNGSAYLEIGVLRGNMIEAALGSEDTKKLNLLLCITDSVGDRYEGRDKLGIPQSTIIESAAHAVPPVAIRGSRRYTISTGGLLGNLE